MAKITKIEPREWKKAKIVQVDVDAKSNIDAIEALEEWAGEHGFARVRENFLRVIVRTDGTPVFRGACYKLTKEETKAVRYELDAVAKRAKRIADAVVISKAAG